MAGRAREFEVPPALERFAESLGYVELDGDEVREGVSSRDAGLNLIRLCRAMFPGSGTQDSLYGSDGGAFSHRPEGNRAIVPLERFDGLSLMNPLLKRNSLYAEQTAFVLPVDVTLTDESLPGSGVGTTALLARNKALEPLVRAGRCVVLPQRLTIRWEQEARRLEYDATAPLHQKGVVDYAPLNPHVPRPSVDDDLLVFKQFMLPYFPNVPQEILERVVVYETDAFTHFIGWLRKRVADLAEKPEEDDLAGLLAEIDEGVARLNLIARRLASSSWMRGVDVAFFPVTLGSLLVLDVQTAAMVAGVAGSVRLVDLLKRYAQRSLDLAPVREDVFFLPYLLAKAGAEDFTWAG